MYIYVCIYMFSTLVMDGIFQKINGTNIITIDQGSLRNRTVKLQKKIMKPTSFGNYICNIRILNLCTRTRYSRLSLRRPGNQIITKVHTITRR